MSAIEGLRTLFTENENLTEREFFRREFGLNLKHTHPSQKFLESQGNQNSFLIATTDPNKWIHALNALPKESVVLFLLGNETYEPLVYNSLNDIQSIRHVFVYNPPSSIENRIRYYSFFGDIFDQLPSLTREGREGIVGAIRDFRAGSYLQQKFSRTDMRYSWSEFPQGYSNRFVSGLQDLGLIHNRDLSLLDTSFICKIKRDYVKIRRFFFVGQETNRRRKQIIEILEERPDSVVIVNKEGFGGNALSSDFSYTHMLVSSWFNAIPPGFFNNSNHRYTESCIVGSIPVILAHNSLDGSKNRNWTNNLPRRVSHSYRLLIDYLVRLTESELLALAQVIALDDFRQLTNTKFLLRQLIY